jgi:hypothetical protein
MTVWCHGLELLWQHYQVRRHVEKVFDVILIRVLLGHVTATML